MTKDMWNKATNIPEKNCSTLDVIDVHRQYSVIEINIHIPNTNLKTAYF